MKSFIVILLLAARSYGFCPKGFGAGNFPTEYKIPAWPQLSLEESAKLYTIKLGGFKMQDINEEYLEGPSMDFVMQGRSTFWQASGQYFMYYCQRYQKWRIAQISAFSKNMAGQCYAFVSDAEPARDILNETKIRGFIEVDNGQWVKREDAGVVEIAKLGDQMDEQEEELEEEEGTCQAPEGTSEEQPQSKCPVKRIARKVVQVATDAGKWARRLFPKYLGAPDEEDAIPDVGNPLFAAEGQGNCEPDKLEGCTIKEQFYIEKQKKCSEGGDFKACASVWTAELQRLQKMSNVVMKPEQKQWVMQRASILQKMVAKNA